MTVAYLYKITNLVNGMLYIGVTKNPRSRMRAHACQKIKTKAVIKNAIAKHGRENFVLEVLCQGSQDYCYELERKAISSYNTLTPNGYNICSGGRGAKGLFGESNGMYGRKGELHPNYGKPGYNAGGKHTDEAKKKMSKAHKGRVFSEATKLKIRENALKRWADPEQRQKMIDSGFGVGKSCRKELP